MTISPLASFDPNLTPPRNTSTNVGGNPISASLNLPQDGAPDISGDARLLSGLQQLEQANPQKFQQVATTIADNLRKAAQNATAQGNASKAAQLNQLADAFQKGAADGQLPLLQDLQQAGLTGHRHHGGHHGHGHAAAKTDSANPDVLNGAFVLNGSGAGQQILPSSGV
jgi:hypothetical protein